MKIPRKFEVPAVLGAIVLGVVSVQAGLDPSFSMFSDGGYSAASGSSCAASAACASESSCGTMDNMEACSAENALAAGLTSPVGGECKAVCPLSNPTLDPADSEIVGPPASLAVAAVATSTGS
ncbi:MAG: hypothetical protein SFX72_22630 [Isosphaeraceae bacterium]|nr:hypothetical protein [Isosphaeraceae bacterium]